MTATSGAVSFINLSEVSVGLTAPSHQVLQQGQADLWLVLSMVDIPLGRG